MSRLYLPKLKCPPATILDHLVAHFPQILPQAWHARVANGLVTTSDGTTVREDSCYRHGITVFYQKEVLSEPEPLEEETIVYRNEEIIVVDKPHGMLVTPAGDHLERALLTRLQRSTGFTDLAPAHRLDRETAGIILFTINTAARGTYQRLFAERMIEREYLAVAQIADPPKCGQWYVENRIAAGDPWFRQRIVDGPPNAITRIELLDLRDGTGLFRLRPETGKKHQLRVHMASIGYPITGDPVYPQITGKRDGDPPLQLLANRLAFIDPLSGVPRTFTSCRHLLSHAHGPR